MAIRLGMDSLVTLWDMGKFYDNIDILIFVDEAARLGYPTMLLCLGLQMHMAPMGAQVLLTVSRPSIGQQWDHRGVHTKHYIYQNIPPCSSARILG